MVLSLHPRVLIVFFAILFLGSGILALTTPLPLAHAEEEIVMPKKKRVVKKRPAKKAAKKTSPKSAAPQAPTAKSAADSTSNPTTTTEPKSPPKPQGPQTELSGDWGDDAVKDEVGPAGNKAPPPLPNSEVNSEDLSLDSAEKAAAEKPTPKKPEPKKISKTAFNEASQLAKRGQHRAAYRKMASSYDLSDTAVPSQVVTSAALWALRGGEFAAAEKVATLAIERRLSWWNEYAKLDDTAGADISEKIEKTTANQRLLMWVAGEAKSMRFANNYDRLSGPQREALKRSTKALYDALIQSDFESEKTEAFNSRILDTEDMVKKRVYAWGWAPVIKQIFWHDDFDFTADDVKYQGQAVAQGVCVGASVFRASFFYDYSLGGCAGMGRAGADFGTGQFGSGRDAFFAMITAGAMKKFSDNHIGLGAELTVFARQINFEVPGTTAAEKEMRVGFAPTLVSRLFTGEKFFFDIKGGKILGVRSALWSLEFGWVW